MKKSLFIFILALLMAVTTSCRDTYTDGPGWGPFYKKSYYQGFFELNDFRIGPLSGFMVNKKNNSINRGYGFDSLKVHEITEGVGVSFDIGNEGIGKGLINYRKGGDYTPYYHILVGWIGDTSYNAGRMSGLSNGRIIAVADTLQTINIICDKQLDEAHPAGSSLNDVFSVYFEDPYAVVKNNYQSVTGKNHYSLDGSLQGFPYSLFGARASELDLSTQFYMGVRWFLVLETAPQHTDAYIFTVSITNKQGKTVERTADPIRLKGVN